MRKQTGLCRITVTVALYYHTLKSLRFSQIAWKCFYGIKRSVYSRFGKIVDFWYARKSSDIKTSEVVFLKGVVDGSLFGSNILNREHEVYRRQAQHLQCNRFVFLNEEVQFGKKIEWQTPNVSKLWRYNLHYFDYLLDLGIHYQFEKQDAVYEKSKEFISSWIQDNPIGFGDGWEPYPISLRAINWIYFFFLFKEKLESDVIFHREFLRSLFKQCLFLGRNLEVHLRGNHLLKNAKALFFAGFLFQGTQAERWRRKGIRMLWKQLEEQVLEDGGHFERSPMYHLIALQDYLECFVLLQDNGEDIPKWVKEKLHQMLYFLNRILHPDGNIPLFNDSALGIANQPGELFSLGAALFLDGKLKSPADGKLGLLPILLLGAEAIERFDRIDVEEDAIPRLSILRDSGYYVLKDGAGKKFLIIDCGKIGAAHVSGHAHCDTLNYELSIGNERIIVDTGVYEYTSGVWREYCRSTRAHNTVILDGQEQSEVWGAFRVARRARPIDVKCIEKPDILFFQGAHNGYGRFQSNLIHYRKIFFVDDRFWIILDEIKGKGKRYAESYIHFAPNAQIKAGAWDEKKRIDVQLNEPWS